MLPNSTIFIDTYLREIEHNIFSYRNQELFEDVLTKEGDASFKYKRMIDVT